MKKLFLQDGKLMLGDFPEEPKWHEIPATPSGCDYEIRDEQRDEYNAAVSAAKASAVEVVNLEEFQSKIDNGAGFTFLPLKEGELHDLPKGWTVEIGYQFKAHNESEFTDCHVSVYQTYHDNEKPHRVRKIARLVPDLSILESKASGTVATGISEHGDKFEVLLYGEWVELSENQYLQAINNNHYGRVNGIEQHRKPVSPPPKAESEDYEAKPLLGDAIYNALMSTTKFLPSEATDLAMTITGELINGLSKDFTVTRKAKP